MAPFLRPWWGKGHFSSNYLSLNVKKKKIGILRRQKMGKRGHLFPKWGMQAFTLVALIGTAEPWKLSPLMGHFYEEYAKWANSSRKGHSHAFMPKWGNGPGHTCPLERLKRGLPHFLTHIMCRAKDFKRCPLRDKRVFPVQTRCMWRPSSLITKKNLEKECPLLLWY